MALDLKSLAGAAILGAALGGGSIKGLDYVTGDAHSESVTKSDLVTLMEMSSPWTHDKPVYEARISRVENDYRELQGALKGMSKDIRRIAMKIGAEVDQ